MYTIYLDGEWGLNDFSGFFSDLQQISKAFADAEGLSKINNDEISDHLRVHGGTLDVYVEVFQVRKVAFSSPGEVAMYSAYTAVAVATFSFLRFLIQTIIQRDDRQILRERQTLLNKALREYIEERIPRYGDTATNRYLLPLSRDAKLDRIIGLISDRNITSVSFPDQTETHR